MIQFNKDQFDEYLQYKIRKSQYGEIEDDISVSEPVIISNIANIRLVFKGKVIFKDKLSLQGVAIDFYNTEFLGELDIGSVSNIYLNSCKSGRVNISKNIKGLKIEGSSIQYININDAIFNKELIILNANIETFVSYNSKYTSLRIISDGNNNSKIENFNFSRGELTNLEIENYHIGSIPDSTKGVINATPSFYFQSKANQLVFSNSKFIWKSEISGNINSIKISKKTSFDNLNIESNIERLSLDSGINIKILNLSGIIKTILLTKVFNIGLFLIDNLESDHLKFNGGKIGNLSIRQSSKIKLFEILTGHLNNLTIESTGIEKIYIKPEVKLLKIDKLIQKSYIDILIDNSNNSLQLGTYEFLDFTYPKDSSSKFIQLKSDVIKFSNFSNYGNLIFSGFRPLNDGEHLIHIENSDLGKMLFMDCDFSGFKMFFQSSKISEIFLAGSIMPYPININVDQDGFLNSDHKRLALTQLKKVFEARGDTLNSTKYNEAELQDWYDSLKPDELEDKKLVLSLFKKLYESRGDIVNAIELQGRELDTQRQILSKKNKVFWERFQLCLNKYSNNFGRSWQWSIGWIVFFNLLFYLLYLHSFGLLNVNQPFDLNLAGYYFEFMNPTHRLDFLKNYLDSNNFTLKGSSITFDFLNRIFIGYLIYQLISAFRKYGKK